jgi:hypothetical protein
MNLRRKRRHGVVNEHSIPDEFYSPSYRHPDSAKPMLSTGSGQEFEHCFSIEALTLHILRHRKQ